MIGRQPYRTRILERPKIEALGAVDSLAGGRLFVPAAMVTLGGFGCSSLGHVAVWRRLVENDLGSSFQIVFFACAASELTVGLPRSVHGLTVTAVAPSSWERQFRAEAEEGGAFAVLWEGTEPVLAMTGLPTEDAWDQFQQRYRSLTR